MLKNKIAIVTGAATGIGFAVAEKLAAEGAKVVIADINETEAQNAVKTIGSQNSCFIYCDVKKKLDIRNLVAATIEKFSSIDILVNNAGIVHKADFLELKEEDFDKVININLKAYFLVAQQVAIHMVKSNNKDASIINMSSINAKVAIQDQLPYCVAKGGVTQLTKVMALSLAKYGIRVNAVGPGSIMTELLRNVNKSPKDKKRILSRTPLGRIGKPQEIASIVSFLASKQASYITGETIYADGGRLALNYVVDEQDS